MLYFENDYTQGAHPEVLAALIRTNEEAQSGYGFDDYCTKATAKIRLAIDRPDAEVRYLVGGTQTNSTVIDALLPQYAGVIASDTGHINFHEAGAIEYTGHKVLTIPAENGKLSAESLKRYLAQFNEDANREHMVQPGMVYISHPSEFGTLYSRDELVALSKVCRENQLPLYLDGARLGYGLTAIGNELDLPTIAKYCDVFYIGGTKVGALCGEALVFPNPETVPSHLMTIIKQHGALLAKGRLLGVQFDALFTNDLYSRISKNAITCARALQGVLVQRGYQMLIDSPTNQQFFVFDNDQVARLQHHVKLSIWEPYDDTHTVVRFVTSWATKMADIEMFAELLDHED